MIREPASFLWGAATSAHQVEGNNIHNDWWQWEQKTPGAVKSGAADDHYRLFREDFALARELGHNAHRLSLEWSRLELKEGQWNEGAIDHYREVLECLRENGLASFVTLHHFTNPMWLSKRGGWENKETPRLFARYAEMVAEHLGDLIDFWVTINEPMVYVTQSYWRACWPPQRHSLRATLKVIRHMAYGHRLAYENIHRVKPQAKVGIANSVIAFSPDSERKVGDKLAAGLNDWWYNHRFFGLTKGTHDFIGLNYYFPRKLGVKIMPLRVEQMPVSGLQSDLGWPIKAEGLTHILSYMKRYRLPIYITENGLADADDSRRADFIRDHLRAIERAQEGGADVRGYLHWSLLDNFEWIEGFKPRFGLVEVNYETMARKPRPSAYVYKAIIEQARK
ncbi:MAG: glycoside hydrolase family 1 protein [Candidatus Andersenbacteria bacterium]|nr:glycoside hydrolase family 1 protein [bacterium]MDZ4225636.1 glycoside hydrolase family 1 protein [Candidatus Andersenbacteria bacterium]